MNDSKQIINNVKSILDRLGELSDKQLLLIYWMQVDDVEMNKETISTKDWLSKSTNAESILDAKRLIEIMKNDE